MLQSVCLEDYTFETSIKLRIEGDTFSNVFEMD